MAHTDNIDANQICCDISNIHLEYNDDTICINWDEVILTISRLLLDKFPFTHPSQLDLLFNGISHNDNNDGHSGYLGNKIFNKLNIANNNKCELAKIINKNVDELEIIFNFIQEYWVLVV